MDKTLVLLWVLLIKNLNFSFIFWFLSLLLWMQRSVSPKPYETCCIWWVIYNNWWCLIINHAKNCKEAVLTKNMDKTHTNSSSKIKKIFFFYPILNTSCPITFLFRHWFWQFSGIFCNYYAISILAVFF